jgi:hypothetical protein
VRENTLHGIGAVVLPRGGPEKAAILPDLLKAAADSEAFVRMSAVYCLRFYQDARVQVIPTLTKAMADYSPDVRIRAVMAFQEVDPEAGEKAGAINVAVDCLHCGGVLGAEGLATDFLTKLDKIPSDENRWRFGRAYAAPR